MGYVDKTVSKKAKKLRVFDAILACLLALCLWGFVICGFIPGRVHDSLELAGMQSVIYVAAAFAIMFSVILPWMLKVEYHRKISKN